MNQRLHGLLKVDNGSLSQYLFIFLDQLGRLAIQLMLSQDVFLLNEIKLFFF
jgi:hypothetical protein